MRILAAVIVVAVVAGAGCAPTERSEAVEQSHRSPMHKWIDQEARSPAKPQSGQYLDLNKNGRKDVYEDPSAPIERRIDDLVAQMNLDEKTCQLATLYGYERVLRDALPTPE